MSVCVRETGDGNVSGFKRPMEAQTPTTATKFPRRTVDQTPLLADHPQHCLLPATNTVTSPCPGSFMNSCNRLIRVWCLLHVPSKSGPPWRRSFSATMYVCVYVCGCIRIYIHTYRHTYVYTYIHIYICIYRG